MRSAQTLLQAAPHQGAASKDPKPGSRQRLTDNPVGPGRPPPPTCALRLGLHQPRPRRRRPRRPISPTRDPVPRKAQTRTMAAQHGLRPDETLPRSRLSRNSPSGRCPRHPPQRGQPEPFQPLLHQSVLLPSDQARPYPSPGRPTAVFGPSGPPPPRASRARPPVSPGGGSRAFTSRVLGLVPPDAVLAARPDSGRRPTSCKYRRHTQIMTAPDSDGLTTTSVPRARLLASTIPRTKGPAVTRPRPLRLRLRLLWPSASLRATGPPPSRPWQWQPRHHLPSPRPGPSGPGPRYSPRPRATGDVRTTVASVGAQRTASRAQPRMSPDSGSRIVTFRVLGPDHVPPGAVLAARQPRLCHGPSRSPPSSSA